MPKSSSAVPENPTPDVCARVVFRLLSDPRLRRFVLPIVEEETRDAATVDLATRFACDERPRTPAEVEADADRYVALMRATEPTPPDRTELALRSAEAFAASALEALALLGDEIEAEANLPARRPTLRVLTGGQA